MRRIGCRASAEPRPARGSSTEPFARFSCPTSNARLLPSSGALSASSLLQYASRSLRTCLSTRLSFYSTSTSVSLASIVFIACGVWRRGSSVFPLGMSSSLWWRFGSALSTRAALYTRHSPMICLWSLYCVFQPHFPYNRGGRCPFSWNFTGTLCTSGPRVKGCSALLFHLSSHQIGRPPQILLMPNSWRLEVFGELYWKFACVFDQDTTAHRIFVFSLSTVGSGGNFDFLPHGFHGYAVVCPVRAYHPTPSHWSVVSFLLFVLLPFFFFFF